jgi:enamine deaminase RidA (YjgF/YER057c/UK114 family)
MAMAEAAGRHPIDARLAAPGLTQPEVPRPVGLLQLARVEGGLPILSGQGPGMPQGCLATGKVGAGVTPEAARGHAMLLGLTLLAAARLHLGGFGRIARVCKVLGFVNATPDFDRHPFVIDGCSELFHRVFGPDAAAHARSAIGVASLPGQITAEIEAIFSLADAGA